MNAEPTHETDSFPDAVVSTDSFIHRWLMRSSNWLAGLTLIALLLAMGYAWMSSGPDGTPITVRFRDGYGLKEKADVRYRGISVGHVTDVRLSSDLKGVVVDALLFPSASDLAREGSVFWVERPQVSFASGVKSLDTLVGGHYLGVIPGPDGGAVADSFVGEPEAPALLDPIEGGMPITLLSEERFGVERGSTLSYRGMVAGQVLQVELDSKGHKVVIHAVIFPRYSGLVRSNTQFWSRNGVDVKIGIKGVDMDLDPMTALSRGAIGFATPTPAGDAIQPGSTFELAESESEGWQDWKPLMDIREALDERRKRKAEAADVKDSGKPKKSLMQRLRGVF